MSDIKQENYSIKQYLKEIIQKPLDIFYELTSWPEEDKQDFSVKKLHSVYLLNMTVF